MTLARIAALAAMLGLAGCHSGDAQDPNAKTGSIKGTVKAQPKEGARSAASYEPGEHGPERLDYDSLDGIVVYVEAPADPTAPPAVLELTDKGFAHDTAAVATGGVLSIQNSSSHPATIYAAGVFDAGTLSPGQSVQVHLDAPGPHEVVVDERDDAHAWVLGLGAARVAVVRSGDDFRFADLPPGDYVVHAWHHRLPGTEQKVTVRAGATSEADLAVTVNGLPAPTSH